jgi:hypothetical protein
MTSSFTSEASIVSLSTGFRCKKYQSCVRESISFWIRTVIYIVSIIFHAQISSSAVLPSIIPGIVIKLSVVGGGRNVATPSCPVDVDVLALLVLLVGVFGLDAECVGTEVVTLSLQQVGGQVLGTVTVVEAERGAESRCGNTPEGALGDDVSPAGLSLVDSLVEEIVEEQVLKVGVGTVSLGDVLQEDGADDASTAPHEGNLGLVELPVVLLGGVLDQHETLSIRDNLGGVKGLLEVVDESLLVAGEAGAGSVEETSGTATLSLERGQAAGEDGLTNESDGHTEVESVDGGPLAGTLLTSRVHDLLDNGDTVVVVLVHDIAGDLDQERVEDTAVPLGENITNLLVAESETALHDVVGLADQLHVTVLDTVVDHLDVVTSTLVTDPLAAGLAVRLGGDGLEDVLLRCQICSLLISRLSYLDVRPGLLVTTGHDGGTVAGTLLSTRNTGTDEADTLRCKVLSTAVCVGVVGVATVDDDVALLDATLVQEELNEVVNGLSGHDEHHHAAGLLKLGAELLDGVSTNDGLALGLCSASVLSSLITMRVSFTIVQETVNLSNTGKLSIVARRRHRGASYVRLKATTVKPWSALLVVSCARRWLRCVMLTR